MYVVWITNNLLGNRHLAEPGWRETLCGKRTETMMRSAREWNPDAKRLNCKSCEIERLRAALATVS